MAADIVITGNVKAGGGVSSSSSTAAVIIKGIVTTGGKGEPGDSSVASVQWGAVIGDIDTQVDLIGRLASKTSTAQAAAAAPVQSVAGKTGTVTLVKGDVGLGNVTNTSDANKPVSTAQQTALDAKQPTLVNQTNIKSINGTSLLGSGDLTIASGGSSSPATFSSVGTVYQTEYNVHSYGAVGDGSTNDKTAIQNAINAAHAAGGGIIRFTKPMYNIGSALTIYSNLTFIGTGDGFGVTTLNQTSTSANGMQGVDIINLTIRDLQIQGPSSGTGIGISLTRSANPDTHYITMENVYISAFGSHGIYGTNVIVSTFRRVVTESNGGKGFYLVGLSGSGAGTSVHFDTCYGLANGQSGFTLDTMIYSSFSNCAVDDTGIGYEIINCQGIVFLGCGSETPANKSTAYPGNAYKISNSVAIGIHGSVFGNTLAPAINVINSQVGIYGVAEFDAVAGTRYWLATDATSVVTVDLPSVYIPTTGTGKVTYLNDGSGSAVIPGPLYMSGLIDMGGTKITSLATPTNPTDATTKAYVDGLASTTPDATSSVKGKIQLTGDLGGTAASPTVPGLTAKAPLASPTFTGTPTLPTGTIAVTQTAGNNTTAVATTAFVTTAVVAAGATPDATTTVKGKVQLAGDLAGTAAAPTVPGLATKTAPTGTIVAGHLPKFSDTTGLVIADSGIDTVTLGNQIADLYASKINTRAIIPISGTISAGSAGNTDYVYLWTGSTAYTLTLPSAASNTNVYTLKNASSVNQTVASTLGSIDGSATATVVPNQSIEVVAVSSNWYII